jgi:hypothetical protein
MISSAQLDARAAAATPPPLAHELIEEPLQNSCARCSRLDVNQRWQQVSEERPALRIEPHGPRATGREATGNDLFRGSQLEDVRERVAAHSRTVAKVFRHLKHSAAHACCADLTSDAGWDAAASGCDYVLHVASPLGMEGAQDAEAMVAPARDGALRVYEPP